MPETEIDYCLYLIKRDGTEVTVTINVSGNPKFDDDLEEHIIKSFREFLAEARKYNA